MLSCGTSRLKALNLLVSLKRKRMMLLRTSSINGQNSAQLQAAGSKISDPIKPLDGAEGSCLEQQKNQPTPTQLCSTSSNICTTFSFPGAFL